MKLPSLFRHVPQAPTNPAPRNVPKAFDVAQLYDGPVSSGEEEAAGSVALDEKLRQAYFWIVNTAIISPHYDVEFNDGPPQVFRLGDSQSPLTLPSAQS
jgi:MoxR-like ATPase